MADSLSAVDSQSVTSNEWRRPPVRFFWVPRTFVSSGSLPPSSVLSCHEVSLMPHQVRSGMSVESWVKLSSALLVPYSSVQPRASSFLAIVLLVLNFTYDA